MHHAPAAFIFYSLFTALSSIISVLLWVRTRCEDSDISLIPNYGFLFYNEENKDSYDSNHALIFWDKVKDLDQVLGEILRFYTAKGITPSIYQSISDDGYFEQIGDELTRRGFDFWTETQNYMVLLGENRIQPTAHT